MSQGRPNLAALVDGAALGEDDARALWVAFSEHMDEHRGDMAGFARARGWHEVAPEYREGQAVLVVRTTPAAPKLAPATRRPTAPASGKGKPPSRRKPAPTPKKAPKKRGR
jgi:hypothetical protein